MEYFFATIIYILINVRFDGHKIMKKAVQGHHICYMNICVISKSCSQTVVASGCEYPPCDFQNVVTSGHNKLWRSSAVKVRFSEIKWSLYTYTKVSKCVCVCIALGHHYSANIELL